MKNMIIKVKNLRLRTVIGLYDFERHKKQNIIINIKFGIDDYNATISDDIKDTVDYGSLTNEIVEKVEATDFQLVERLCKFIADIVLANKKVTWVEVEVDKPEAPVQGIDSVAVFYREER
jgi:dihydroneopterin aldolase